MHDAFTVRPYSPRDLDAVRALDQRVEPYLPEHQPEVERMYVRAGAARLAGERWLPAMRTAEPLDSVDSTYSAFWVACSAGGAMQGIIGARPFSVHRGEIDAIPIVGDWAARDDVAELCHLRVAPEARRAGVGLALSLKVIDWARSSGYCSLVLSTTTPQFPARTLYQSVGFEEKAVSYVGRYEVIWYQLWLTDVHPQP